MSDGITYTSISADLRGLRQAAGITVREMADVIGVTERTILRYERADTRPPIDDMQRWAEACGFRLVLRFEPLTGGTRGHR